ncbi:MAG: crotonase/enoyl-CoA hydratase family protein [Proteobacteria bacterium]|nr:crotonase/enoyl-CoA hydratase family protein [Pseudomonadota bacterium]MDE3208561.1 crotonase/enoyl-CoA hydratase family protein [Pseudomonadota bacterium]
MNMRVAVENLSPSTPFAGTEYEDRIDYLFSPQLNASYSKSQHTMWLRLNPSPRPCFNLDLLQDLHDYTSLIDESKASIVAATQTWPIEYTVLASSTSGVFNLGGDLHLFMELIETQNRPALSLYGRACINVLYRNYCGYDLPLTTISLVQGECLGGGFEAALSSEVIIAEEHSRFGFPEILFNLFPGMGAYSFLSRRCGQRLTDEIISSGKIYSAQEMLEMGIIDQVVFSGEGEKQVLELIESRKRFHNGLVGLSSARRRAQNLKYQELLDIVEAWVDCALRLTCRDLKLMKRLVSRQNEIPTAKAA